MGRKDKARWAARGRLGPSPPINTTAIITVANPAAKSKSCGLRRTSVPAMNMKAKRVSWLRNPLIRMAASASISSSGRYGRNRFREVIGRQKVQQIKPMAKPICAKLSNRVLRSYATP